MTGEKCAVDHISKDRVGSASSNANPGGGKDDKNMGKTGAPSEVGPRPNITFGAPEQKKST